MKGTKIIQGGNQPSQYTKPASRALLALYLVTALEFFIMASPFAAHFYTVYGPGLRFLNESAGLAWLGSFFLPHIVAATSSPILDARNITGVLLVVIGFTGFCIGAAQVYYRRLSRKGAVTGGLYWYIRHPQYTAFALCSLGLVILWPRNIVLLTFITMLFAYYFLAKLEERRCEAEFGSAYRDYQKKTGMFLPFRLPFTMRLSDLPASGPLRYAAIATLWVTVSAGALIAASGLRVWSVSSLYTYPTDNAVYLSITRMRPDSLEQITAIVLDDPRVQELLEAGTTGPESRMINYVLPDDMSMMEIPMQPVEGSHGHHILSGESRSPITKIVFTKATLHQGCKAEGLQILSHATGKVPLLEVRYDPARREVLDVRPPSATPELQNIPAPLF
jgi:protein-S-isoprenylcysteine O-methyltransferase Ste14